MKYLFIVMGKSGAGKDTVLNRILEDDTLKLNKVIPFTTRAIRDGEVEGVNYNFITDEEFNTLLEDNKVLEYREYNYAWGPIKYGTMEDADLVNSNSIMVNTLAGCKSIMEHYKDCKSLCVIPIYISVPNYERLLRSLQRESNAKSDKAVYEFCRRLIADEEDFSEEKVKDIVPLNHVFINIDLKETVMAVKELISKLLQNTL